MSATTSALLWAVLIVPSCTCAIRRSSFAGETSRLTEQRARINAVSAVLRNGFNHLDPIDAPLVEHYEPFEVELLVDCRGYGTPSRARPLIPHRRSSLGRRLRRRLGRA